MGKWEIFFHLSIFFLIFSNEDALIFTYIWLEMGQLFSNKRREIILWKNIEEQFGFSAWTLRKTLLRPSLQVSSQLGQRDALWAERLISTRPRKSCANSTSRSVGQEGFCLDKRPRTGSVISEFSEPGPKSWGLLCLSPSWSFARLACLSGYSPPGS